ncbi:MAG: serine--tRNA ligase [Bacteroidia bacterium]
MLQIPFLRENRAMAQEALQRKKVHDAGEILDQLLNLDDQKRLIQTQVEQNQATLNAKAKAIGTAVQQGQQEHAVELKSEVAQIKQENASLEIRLHELQEAIQNLLLRLPNLPHASVPTGHGPAENEVVYLSDPSAESTQREHPHWEIAQQYKLIDFELGVKVTGAGFPVYLGAGARLQRALIQYFLDFNVAAGYTEIQPPILVNEDSGFGTGQLPDKEGQMYYVTEDRLYLAPTAEVPVTNLYRDRLLQENELPVLNTAYTPCFRREAGSYGKDVRGLNRLHQFDKVEIVQIVHPDHSYSVLEKMRDHVQSLVASLGMPFRILKLCGGDMGFASALTYDFEIWSAGQGRWLEISSVSNFESFQTNRLKLRFKDSLSGKTRHAHSLNGSALALPRVLAALLEFYTDSKGIKIPAVLQPYMQTDIIPKP